MWVIIIIIIISVIIIIVIIIIIIIVIVIIIIMDNYQNQGNNKWVMCKLLWRLLCLWGFFYLEMQFFIGTNLQIKKHMLH